MSQRFLAELRDVSVHFPVTRGLMFRRHVGVIRAVDGVSLGICRGETLGLVGESGCGKSTLGRALLQLVRPSGGQVLVDGVDLCTLSRRQLLPYRKRLQVVFQDPYASLNPRMTVGSIVAEPLREHRLASGDALRARLDELMGLVGLDSRLARRYPHELSGGQRQRVGIARALALEPELIVCDEPVSALDVSVQAQVISLLQDLQERLGLTYLFIAHDLAAVRHISDRVAVMYMGRVVELGRADEVVCAPRHPYTKALVSAIPIPDPALERSRQRILLDGDVPSAMALPSGCRFRTRCPSARPECAEAEPPLDRVEPEAEPAHFVACPFA